MQISRKKNSSPWTGKIFANKPKLGLHHHRRNIVAVSWEEVAITIVHWHHMLWKFALFALFDLSSFIFLPSPSQHHMLWKLSFLVCLIGGKSIYYWIECIYTEENTLKISFWDCLAGVAMVLNGVKKVDSRLTSHQALT